MKPLLATVLVTLITFSACDPTEHSVVVEAVPVDADRVEARTLGGYAMPTEVYDLSDGTGRIAIATLPEGLTPSAELRAFRGGCLVAEAYTGLASRVRMQPVRNCGLPEPAKEPPPCPAGQERDGDGQCASLVGSGVIVATAAHCATVAPGSEPLPVFGNPQTAADACRRCSCPDRGDCTGTLTTYANETCAGSPVEQRPIALAVTPRCEPVRSSSALKLSLLQPVCTPVRPIEKLPAFARGAALCMSTAPVRQPALFLFFEGDRSCPASRPNRWLFFRGSEGETACACSCTPSAGSCTRQFSKDISLTVSATCGPVINQPAPALLQDTCASSAGFAAVQINSSVALPGCTASGQPLSTAQATGALTACGLP